MVRHRIAVISHRTSRHTVTCLAVAAALVTAMPEAGAATPAGGWHGGGQGNGSVIIGNGSGRFVKNNLAVNSPTFARGNQHLFNQNVGGQNPSQLALCKRKVRGCRLIQRMVTYDP